MICRYENGDDPTASELKAVYAMLKCMRGNMRADPWKVLLRPGFAVAAVEAISSGNYQLLYHECVFFW